jgi:hypothetical protein
MIRLKIRRKKMKLNLLKNVGDLGVITEWKTFVDARLEILCPEEGTMSLGQRVYKVYNGRVSLPEWELMQGSNKINFIAADGRVYRCGEIKRSGRFISVVNNLDGMVVDLALAYERQSALIEELVSRLDDLENNHGIKIV